MTQFPHDEFIKDYLPQLLGSYGIALAAVKVATEIKEIDVLFTPTQPVPTEILGLLGLLAQQACAFEVFRNPVTPEEIRTCVGKFFDFKKIQQKEISKPDKSLPDAEIERLWLLTPTLSHKILDSFGAISLGTPGIYLLPNSWQTGIVVIHQLPTNPETLWLRVMGKAKVQVTALEELKNLPAKHPYKESVLELIYKLLSILEVNRRSGQTLEAEDLELMMRIETLYQEKLQEATQQGVQIGTQQGIQIGTQQAEVKLTIRQLKRLLGDLPPQVESLISALPIATLDILAEDLLDFLSLDDLTQWLNRHSEGGI